MNIIYRNIKDLIGSLKPKEPELYEALARINENLVVVNGLLNNPKFDKITLGEIVFPDDTNLLTKRSALTQCCRIFRSTTVTIANGVPTIMTFNIVIFDTDRLTTLNTSATRITINTAGIYLVGAEIRWDSNSAGYRIVEIIKNGVTTINADIMMAVSGQVTIQNLVTLYKFNRGDYIELSVTHTIGFGNLNISSVPEHSPIFWVHRES